MRLLTPDEIIRQLGDLPDWAIDETAPRSTIAATFRFDDFAGSLAFVNTVGDLAEQADHHPDIDIRWNTVRLALSTHSAGGLTQADIELAHQISAEQP